VNVLANDRLRLLIERRCNCACFYCHNEGQPVTGSSMSPDSVGVLVDALRSHGVRVLEVTISGGEPLLHPGLAEVVALIARLGTPVTVVSNGLLAGARVLEGLRGNGLTRFRLGLDSFRPVRSAPPHVKAIERSRASALVRCAQENDLDVDLNVVVTRHNREEIGSLVGFAIAHGVPVKFFEHVAVHRDRCTHRGTSLTSDPQVSREEFQRLASAPAGGAVEFRPDEEFGEANHIAVVGGTQIRYCRYLCDFDLCWMTGTRIDPEGNAYSCMMNHGLDLVSYESSESVVQSLRKASSRPCRHDPRG